MSDARYDRLVALAKQTDSTFVLTPETVAIFRAVAADADTRKSDIWAGYILGLMDGSDDGAAFRRMTMHFTGIETGPSMTAIEMLLSTLREKFNKGWRLVPPPEEPAA